MKTLQTVEAFGTAFVLEQETAIPQKSIRVHGSELAGTLATLQKEGWWVQGLDCISVSEYELTAFRN